MNINPINQTKINFKHVDNTDLKSKSKSYNNSDKLIKELDRMSMINNVNINKKNFELNLTRDELEKRTHKDYLTTKKMLTIDCEEYANLAEGDKKL